ncbi:class I SAM-dependent methyltransferase [Streptomyces sp. NBC_01022]|uniref:class I SAM-dependent methyltransferase n=1 Tax=Streptomyces sp. NBC_01022 TaxID=2903723 RepID=UPI002DDB9AA0|nr:class I SAM-dependent methyltransferase [Streptomyces sp. NBC_01022]WRZ78913.1 class I SAM-dependent methyltransferase [Streptomyces sp. NBC_01022]WRZ86766.1 class I SAM-dependent methyltransferase [Streptomyces sp. NBC_01022]
MPSRSTPSSSARAARRLLSDDALHASTVVANNTMNRERGLTGVNSYTRELGFDPLTHLSAFAASPSWLDLCSGEGRALRTAAAQLPASAVLTGVDLVGPLSPSPPPPPGLELVKASVTDWEAPRAYDLITCVHGLHYLGDQLRMLARAASWLSPGGLLAAHFDPGSVRWTDGSPASRPVVAALRAAGFTYDSRHHRLTLRGPRLLRLPFRYVGADAEDGPNYTGQPAVGSYYEPAHE